MRTFCEECAQRREREAASRAAGDAFEREQARKANPGVVWFFRAVFVGVAVCALAVCALAVCALAVWHDARGRAGETPLKAAHDRRKAPYLAPEMRPLRAP